MDGDFYGTVRSVICRCRRALGENPLSLQPFQKIRWLPPALVNACEAVK